MSANGWFILYWPTKMYHSPHSAAERRIVWETVVTIYHSSRLPGPKHRARETTIDGPYRTARIAIAVARLLPIQTGIPFWGRVITINGRKLHGYAPQVVGDGIGAQCYLWDEERGVARYIGPRNKSIASGQKRGGNIWQGRGWRRE